MKYYAEFLLIIGISTVNINVAFATDVVSACVTSASNSMPNISACVTSSSANSFSVSACTIAAGSTGTGTGSGSGIGIVTVGIGIGLGSAGQTNGQVAAICPVGSSCGAIRNISARLFP